MPMLRTISLVLIACGASGCVSYAPARVAAMSTYQICEAQVGQNLTEETRAALRSELDRRQETCAPHLAAIHAQREDDFHEQVYGKASP